MRYCVDGKILGLLVLIVLLWGLPALADEELDAQVKKFLEELEQPWIGGCNALEAGVDRKRLLLTGILYVGMKDPKRSGKLEEEFWSQYESLDEERRYLFAPVLSYRARQEHENPEWALKLWRRSVRLLDKAALPADCPDSLLQNWQRKVNREGVLIMTWGGLRADDEALLLEATNLAEAMGRPDLGPVQEDLRVDRPPAVLAHEPAVYPQAAYERGVEGTVMLQVFVTEYGEVLDAQLVQGVDPLLDRSALDAAWLCRFTPARRGGMPAKAWVELPFEFRLK